MFFAESHAALRAHLSWCKVSSCDLSSNFGAQRLRSWGAHFWIIPCDGPFLSRILFWCQVPLAENLTACFDPNIPGSQRIVFLGLESWDTQPNCIDSFNVATVPLSTTFFRLLVGLSFCLNMSEMTFVAMYTTFFRLVIQTHGRMPESIWRIFKEFVSAWNFTLVSRVLLFIASSLWGFLSLAVSLFCLRMGCGRRRPPFSSLTWDLVSRG